MPHPDNMGLTTRDASPAAVRRVVRDNYGLLAAAGLWTVAIGASLGANLLFDEVAVEDLARIEARTAYRELLRTKAPVMGPHISRLDESVLAFRGHVTSLNSIVPESQPDAWERRALQRLAGGTAEVSQTSRIDGQEYLRLMHSLTVEPGCLSCHSQQGFRLGETRGGFSVAVPVAPLWAAHSRHMRITILGYGLIWLIGLGACALLARILHRRTKEKQQIEATFRDLFENAPVPYHELDLEGRILRLNRAECDLLGYEAERLIGRPVWDIVAAGEREAAREALRRKLNGTQALSPVQRRYTASDGRELVVEIHDRLVRDSSGKTVGIRAAVLDITARVAAERALRDREETFQTVCNSSLNAIVMMDGEARTILWNPAAERMFGYTAAEMIGQPLRDLVVPADLQAKFRASFPTFQKTGQGSAVGKVLELTALRKGGAEFPIEVAVSSVQKGQQWQAVAIIRDITERKAAEKRQRMLAHTIQSADECISITDTEDRILYVNRAFLRTYGYREDELLGQPIAMLRSARTSEEVRAVILPATLDGSWNGELWNRTKEGREFPISLATSVVCDEAGRKIALVGFARDITERREAEERVNRYVRDLETEREIRAKTALELVSAKEAAEASTRAKGEFLANMSHEIRTPMNGVLGMAELALATDLNSEQRDYISTVKSSGESLLAVINDILDFSKIEAGKLDLDPVEFSLQDCMIGVLRTVAPMAHEKGIELACESSEEVPEVVMGDAGRLRQIILNVVNNAVKFTERGEVVLTAAMEDGLVRFAVRDTGIGIAPEKVDLIFQPFCQADASTTRKFGGTGLGLSISVRLVSLMGGRMWVESLPGQGTTFLFTARFTPATAPAAPPAPGLPVSFSVLAVDDNATNRRILEKQLERWGATPVMAAGGKQALEILDRIGNPFHLIITDCHMPEMDGFQFVTELHRRWPQYRGRVLMLSSAASTGDVAHCHAVGVVRHVLKPLKGPDLLGAILQMIAEKEAQDGARRSAPVGASSAKTPPARSLRVLLAEDQLVNQRVAQRMLEKLGHKVTLANNGKEAVALWKPGLFDLILMDVQMPEMDGFEATTAIRAQSGDIPIIALTAHAMAGDREQCLQRGMDGYLQKPIQSKDLAAVLTQHGQAGPKAREESAAD